MRGVIVLALLCSLASADDFDGGTIIFARGTSLVRVDAKGKGETEIGTLPGKVTVRALRTDAAGKVLLADLDGKWSWMPLDGSTKALAELPCAAGPAQLADDASCVVCRSASDASQTTLYNFAKGKSWPLAIPPDTARLAGSGDARVLVWADADGVWTAPLDKPTAKTKVAPDAPARGFLASPDASRAIGVYHDEVFTDAHNKKRADVLMGFALDGAGVRRKASLDALPIEWSHDSQWVLTQDPAQACVVRATGGEYRCYGGYTGVSVSGDGKWTLLLGNRDPKGKQPAPKLAGGDDVVASIPAGPLALYRGKLEGLIPEKPVIVVGNVDGAAVWVPKAP
jgi:hypothetical protein